MQIAITQPLFAWDCLEDSHAESRRTRHGRQNDSWIAADACPFSETLRRLFCSQGHTGASGRLRQRATFRFATKVKDGDTNRLWSFE